MNHVEDFLDDVQALLKSLENAGITLLEKNVLQSSGHEINNPAEDRPADAPGYCSNCGLLKMSLARIKGQGTGSSGVVFVSLLPCLEATESRVLLEKIITAMNLEPGNSYITSIVKCMPQPGFLPSDQDISCCINYLYNEISSLKPVVVILLGRQAAGVFLGKGQSFGLIEGKFHDLQGTRFMPVYHTDDLLKDASKKRNVWEAMKKVMTLISPLVQK